MTQPSDFSGGLIRGASRREFLLRGCGSAVAVMAVRRRARAAEGAQPLIGSQLYGWGQFLSREKKKLAAHLGEVLAALRDAGYDYAEGSMDSERVENNERFAAQLKERGLRPVSLYTGGRLHEEGRAGEVVDRLLGAAKVCQGAGFSIINCNPDPIGREKTDAELRTQAGALRDLGAGLMRLGMKLGVHNHTPEMRREARELHANFRATDPAVVGFCCDVHWVYRGGMDPMKALELYGARVVSWHLRQSRASVWWEDLDDGDVDYGAIARVVRERGLTRYYTVELALEAGTKITRSAVENHRRSREYVRRIFGV